MITKEQEQDFFNRLDKRAYREFEQDWTEYCPKHPGLLTEENYNLFIKNTDEKCK